MFCMKCGKQLPDEARFCQYCGAPVALPSAEEVKVPVEEPAPAPTPDPIPETPDSTPEIPPVEESTSVSEFPFSPITEEAPTPKKKKKNKLVLGIVIAAVAVVVALIAVVGAILLFREEPLPGINPAYVDRDGTAYVCYEDGKFVKLGGEVDYAYMTPDNKKILVIEAKGWVYWTDAKKTEKHEIVEENENVTTYIANMTNRYVAIHTVETGKDAKITHEWIRYEFKTNKKIVYLTETLDATQSSDVQVVCSNSYDAEDLALLTAQDGVIRVLKPGSEKLEEISTFSKDERIELRGISTDGNIMFWVSAKNDKYSVVVYQNGEEENVSSGDLENGSIPTFEMNMDPDGKIAVIVGSDRTIFVNGGEVEEIRLTTQTTNSSQAIFTTNGMPLDVDMDAAKAKGYYIIGEDTDGTYTVFLVRFADAERSKLISKVTGVFFAQDMIFYKKDGSLRYAKVDVKHAELKDETKIANDVSLWNVAYANADYIYYLKNYSSTDQTYDLYVYDRKEDDSEKIESDVFGNLEVSTDGRYVYYYTDCATKSDLGISYGTLNVYDVKEEESNVITDDVIVYSLTSQLLLGELDPNCLWFEKYQNTTDNSYNYNVCYFNGKKTVSIVKNLEA